MPAERSFSSLIGIPSKKLSKEENILLEAELFIRICEELRDIYRRQHQDYFRFMKFTVEMEEAMLDEHFIRWVIRDILLTKEYTLEGIANYTYTPEDVVHEVIAGRNTNPSVTFLRRLIELHRSLRCDLYNTILTKIISEYTVRIQVDKGLNAC